VVLATSSVITAVRTYPYYFPYVNVLSFGHPAYALVNDSNVDWNQSLPEVKRFADQHELPKIAVDAYGFSDATVWAPQAVFWDCQTPAEENAGKWVALSANMIYDGHSCGWLLPYPREALAGGSMYAVQLPAHIPAAGSQGGPPLRSDFREFGGAPFDLRRLFAHVIETPDDLPRAMQWMQSAFTAMKNSQPPPKLPWER
jgi:hypothetical protein